MAHIAKKRKPPGVRKYVAAPLDEGDLRRIDRYQERERVRRGVTLCRGQALAALARLGLDAAEAEARP